jgi:hypothetical protein
MASKTVQRPPKHVFFPYGTESNDAGHTVYRYMCWFCERSEVFHTNLEYLEKEEECPCADMIEGKKK